MKTNDYEKAEKRSFEKYEASELREAIAEPNEWLAHKRGFKDGHEFEKAHINPSNERLQVAAMAMQGLLSSRVWMKAIIREISPENNDADDIEVINLVSVTAVNLADALLNELNKEDNG